MLRLESPLSTQTCVNIRTGLSENGASRALNFLLCYEPVMAEKRGRYPTISATSPPERFRVLTVDLIGSH